MNSSQQDEEETDQCEGVSHMILDDFFVPVSMETADVSFQDVSMAGESKFEEKSSSNSLPDTQNTCNKEVGFI